MPRRLPPIARIRLARSWVRLFTLPTLLVAAGVAAAVAAILLVPAPFGYVLAAAAAIPVVVGLVLGVRVATMRLDVEEATVRVRWVGGDRNYALVPGPVTRVRLRGDHASRLRARSTILGWQLGPARLRDEEAIEVVRLAPTRTAILVPTDRGRLAIAAASEPDLLDALSRAARARKRLEDLVGQEAPAPAAEEPSAPEGFSPSPDDAGVTGAPHVLTGIERAMLEERLAREQMEADTGPDVEPSTEPAAGSHLVEPGLVVADAGPLEPAPSLEAAAPASDTGAAATAMPGVAPVAMPSVVFVLLPLVATLGLWGAGVLLGRLPEPTSDDGRLTALALVLAGPGTSVGAIMARSWWPRLVGVVVTSGLASAVFIGRALFGG